MKRDIALNKTYISQWWRILYPEMIFFTPFVNTNWHLLEELCMATHLEPDRRWGRLDSFFQGCQAPIKIARLPQRQHFPVFLNQQQQKYFSIFFNCIFSSCWWQVPCVFPVWKNGLPNFVCSGNPVFGLYITRIHTTQVTHTHTHAHTHAHSTLCFPWSLYFLHQ